MVFFGHDGLDELTTVDSSTVLDISDGAITRSTLDPTKLGLGRAMLEDLRGGDAAVNAGILNAAALAACAAFCASA